MGLQVNNLAGRGFVPVGISPGSAQAESIRQQTAARGLGLAGSPAKSLESSGLSSVHASTDDRNKLLESLLAGIERDELSLPGAYRAWNTNAMPEDPFKDFRGKRVEVDHGDAWVWGIIKKMNADGSFQIMYEEDCFTEDVGKERIKNLFGTDMFDGCQNCETMSGQILALTQSLAGIAGAAFNWSVGLTRHKRLGLAQLLVDYLKPCTQIHSSLELLCFELEHVNLSAHERPSKSVQTIWQEPADDDYSSEQVQSYLLDNSIIQSAARGIGFRNSPNMADTACAL